MNDLVAIDQSLQQQDLFVVFKNQLRKDFENCGLNVDFINQLPQHFYDLRNSIELEIKQIEKQANTSLYSLLYRIDISELQIKSYLKKNESLSFETAISELIIKRILQKVIFKKHYSK